MAKIELTQTHMLVHLSLAEKIFSLHGNLKLPAALIKGAEVADKEVWKTLGLRLPGTGVPTMLAYGSFWRKAGWTFALWRASSETLSITLNKGAGNRYKRLVIAVDDAQVWADTINDALVSC